jgi:hypothetical protein
MSSYTRSSVQITVSLLFFENGFASKLGGITQRFDEKVLETGQKAGFSPKPPKRVAGWPLSAPGTMPEERFAAAGVLFPKLRAKIRSGDSPASGRFFRLPN